MFFEQQWDYEEEIDEVGGATSTTSKVAIVSRSTRPDADVDYAFAQATVGQGTVDFSGNCGNMASGVGPFALEEGLVQAMPGQTEVKCSPLLARMPAHPLYLDIRVFNTNTNRLLLDTVKVDSNESFDETGDYKINGVVGTGSEIKVSFLHPAGSMTGSLFPTGNKKDTLAIPSSARTPQYTITATLIDATSPFIFIDSATMPPTYHKHGPSARKASA